MGLPRMRVRPVGPARRVAMRRDVGGRIENRFAIGRRVPRDWLRALPLTSGPARPGVVMGSRGFLSSIWARRAQTARARHACCRVPLSDANGRRASRKGYRAPRSEEGEEESRRGCRALLSDAKGGESLGGVAAPRLLRDVAETTVWVRGPA